jgi:hypothetical protein
MSLSSLLSRGFVRVAVSRRFNQRRAAARRVDQVVRGVKVATRPINPKFPRWLARRLSRSRQSAIIPVSTGVIAGGHRHAFLMRPHDVRSVPWKSLEDLTRKSEFACHSIKW